MEPFDTIEKLITEHGSASILREHLDLLKSQMSAMQAKISELNMTLEKRDSEIIALKNKIDILESENANLKQQIGSKDKIEGEVCPYCKQSTLKLLDIKPAEHFGVFGAKVYYYKCQNTSCGREYDKQVN